MKNIIVAVIGEDKDADEILYKCFKKFYPQELVLLTKEKYEKKSSRIAREMEKFEIPVKIELISNFPHMEEVFMKVRDIERLYIGDVIVINVDTDYMTSCLALSSAFVNGVQAIGVLGDEIIAYPIMKFSYYNAINEKKMVILRQLNAKKDAMTMDEIAKAAKLSLPLVAYHLRGNRDSKGLEQMNLIETSKVGTSVCVALTELGKLIVNGYVDVCEKKA